MGPPSSGTPILRSRSGRRWPIAVRSGPSCSIPATSCLRQQVRIKSSGSGKPLVHQGAVRSVAYSADGKTALTGSDDHHARLWSVPSPARGDVDRIQLWIQVLTGIELDPQGDYRVLDAAIWRERRERLAQL